MKFKIDERSVVTTIAIIIIALTVFTFLKIASTVIIAATIAMVLWPVVEKIYMRYRSVKIAALAGTGIVFVAFLLMFILPLTLILINYQSLVETAESAHESLLDASKRYSVGFLDFSKLVTISQAAIVTGSITFVSNIGWYAFLVILFFMSLYLMFRYGWDIQDKYQRLHMEYPNVKRFLDRLYESAFNILYVVYVVFFVLAVATFLLAIPFFWILGYDNFLLYALITGIFNFIPLIGSTAIILIVFAHQLIIGNMWGVIFTIFFGYFIVSTFPELYIRPKLIGEKSDINWMIIFIAITGGVLLTGIWGFVFGPLLLTLTKTSYDMLVEVHGRRHK